MTLHVDKYERIFLYLTIAVLVAAFAAVVTTAVASDIHLPDKSATILPEDIDATPPFDAPGLYQVGDDEYQAVIIAQAFNFTPDEIRVPRGATVTFLLVSRDVIHGFMVPRTNVNAMVVPGQVTEITYQFKDAGEFQIICHEYCGIGHHQMYGKVVVEG